MSLSDFLLINSSNSSHSRTLNLFREVGSCDVCLHFCDSPDCDCSILLEKVRTCLFIVTIKTELSHNSCYLVGVLMGK